MAAAGGFESLSLLYIAFSSWLLRFFLHAKKSWSESPQNSSSFSSQDLLRPPDSYTSTLIREKLTTKIWMNVASKGKSCVFSKSIRKISTDFDQRPSQIPWHAVSPMLKIFTYSVAQHTFSANKSAFSDCHPLSTNFQTRTTSCPTVFSVRTHFAQQFRL